MKGDGVPVDWITSLTATPRGSPWELIAMTPSGFENPVRSTLYLSTAVGTVRMIKKGSVKTSGLAVAVSAMFTSTLSVSV